MMRSTGDIWGGSGGHGGGCQEAMNKRYDALNHFIVPWFLRISVHSLAYKLCWYFRK